MHHTSPVYLSLLLVALLAFIVPIFTTYFNKIRLPVALGELIAGIIFGKSGFGLLSNPDPVLDFLSDFGLAYLMFLCGLELDIMGMLPRSNQDGRRPWRRWFASPAMLNSMIFALTLAGALGSTYLMVRYRLLSSFWLSGLILATCSVGVVLPVLKERGLVGTAFGQMLLGYTSIADFGTMILLAVYLALHSGKTIDLVFLLLFSIAFLVLYHASALLNQQPLIRRLVNTASNQFDIRASLTLILIFLALAHQTGVTSIVGAFLAGTIISLISSEERELLHHKLDAIGYGFFVPIFFIMFGAQFDLVAAVRSHDTWLIFFPILGVAFLSKLIPALLYRFRFSWRQTIAGGFLISTQLSLTVAASNIGLRLGILNSATVAAFILMAIVTCLIGPIVFNRLVEMRVGEGGGVIIAGDTELAGLLARRMADANKRVMLVASGRLSEQTFPETVSVIPAAADPSSALHQAGATGAETVVILFEEKDANVHWANHARSHFEALNVVTCLEDMRAGKSLSDVGIYVIQHAGAALALLEIAVRAPRMLELIEAGNQVGELREAVLLNATLHDRPLRMAGLPPGILVITITRSQQRLLPNGETLLRLGDRLTLVGKGVEMKIAVAHLQSGGKAANPNIQ